MNKLFNILLFAVIAMMAASCAYDNYDEPGSLVTGKIVYNGQPLGVRGSSGEVYLQFWQYGWPNLTAINTYVGQDGTFSALLFDGTYQLVMNSNRGPWVNSPDTVRVEVKGKTIVEYPVKPYFTISNPTYSLTGTTLTASFDVTEITAGRTIESVALMVNKTSFVDNSAEAHVNWVTEAGHTPGRINLTLNVSNNMNEVQLYARVGLKISGINQWLFDPNVKKIK